MKKEVLIKSTFVIILFSLLLIPAFNDKKSIKKPSISNYIKVEKKKLNKKETYGNENIIGNIRIKGTNVDEYIVKSSDNEYYLNHNLKKEYDIAGAVFMDYRNNIDDKKLLIFGHNARNLQTVPFHELENYLDYDFYSNHKYIDLTFGDNDSKWLIFSVMVVNKGDNTHMELDFAADAFLYHINYLKSNSIYETGIDVNGDDNIVIIQTCNYNPEDTYILICAKKVK